MAQTKPNEHAVYSPDAGPPLVGERAPEFTVQTPTGPTTLAELASRVGTLVLVSLDSYRFHPD